ncbi:MAG: hypothetical protein J5I47_05340 [Vicingus serpentipes]|nr:hypothetical protein [Vicingus serpentipes]
MVFLLLICKILFFIGIGGLASFSVITRLSTDPENNKVNFLYALGLGPALASLVIYYLLLIIPSLTSSIYLSIILLFFVSLIFVNLKAISIFLQIVKSLFVNGLTIFQLKKGLKNYFYDTNNVLIGILLIVMVFGVKNILLTQIPGHDVLEYMTQGDYIFHDKAIEYVAHRYYPKTGFYYVGLHGWSFPLQVTLEKMVDDLFFFGYDLYFKSLTLFYGILLLLIIYYWTKRYMNVVYAFSIVCVLCLAKGYLTSISYFHIDSYRMFFFSLSFLFTLQQINNPNLKLLVLLSFFAGTSGFTHSLGVIISVIIGAGLFLYIQKDWIYKSKFLLLYTVLVLLFGEIHYIIDIVHGTGWIFKEIDFY